MDYIFFWVGGSLFIGAAFVLFRWTRNIDTWYPEYYDDIVPIMSKDGRKLPMTLEVRPYGDGRNYPGFTNIVCDEWQLIIATNVEETLAREIVRRYNSGIDQ